MDPMFTRLCVHIMTSIFCGNVLRRNRGGVRQLVLVWVPQQIYTPQKTKSLHLAGGLLKRKLI